MKAEKRNGVASTLMTGALVLGIAALCAGCTPEPVKPVQMTEQARTHGDRCLELGGICPWQLEDMASDLFPGR